MKKFLISLMPILFVLGSCEDIFERTPLDKISDSDVWKQESLMRAYLTDIYARLPWQSYDLTDRYTDFGTERFGNYTNITQGTVSRTSEGMAFWNYSIIRDMNVFLEKMVDSPVSEQAKKQMEGEVRTMRAWVYFEKQKRYGGVPLVDVVLDPFSEIDEKYSKRATEEAIADFIDSELSTAIDLLESAHTSLGRINKWVAYAFKARANLWSASIAKYSSVQINGVVGIPASRANEFYRKAADAADAVIKSGRYSLYNKIPDRTENFYRLFFEDNDNPEVIFARLFDGVNVGHAYTQNNVATRYSSGQGSSLHPTLDLCLLYENIDGSLEQPEIGPDHLYEDGLDLFSNKDPRLRATVFFQGEEFRGDIIRTYDGLDPNPVPNPGSILADWTYSYEGIPSVGADSRLQQSHNRTQSGFLTRKYIRDFGAIFESNIDVVSWKYFRLAEMYLTIAEAEFEMENLQPAVIALNATRERAGISLVDETTITLDHIRRERSVEFAWEGFRWWDLRRWRAAESVLQTEIPVQGLRTILHYETGKFYFLPLAAETYTRVFRPEHYYNPITEARRENNPDLVENPIY